MTLINNQVPVLMRHLGQICVLPKILPAVLVLMLGQVNHGDSGCVLNLVPKFLLLDYGEIIGDSEDLVGLRADEDHSVIYLENSGGGQIEGKVFPLV